MNDPRSSDRRRLLPGFRWAGGRDVIRALACGVAVWVTGVGPCGDGGRAEAATVGDGVIRFGFASSMFGGVNENDARAAMKVYAETLGGPANNFVIADPYLFAGTNSIGEALASGSAEMFALTTPEFVTLEPLGLSGPILLSEVKETVTEVYLLLTRADGAIPGVVQLKSRSLAFSTEVRSCLATVWLEVILREHGMGSPERELGRFTPVAKASQAVLPVYFGKTDACLVTRASWDVMCELNPQLPKKLRVIASSPPVVPALTCFRRDLSEDTKRRVVDVVRQSSTKPAYLQMMQLFKADRVGPHPISVLDGTRELLSRHGRLVGTSAGSPSGTARGEVPR